VVNERRPPWSPGLAPIVIVIGFASGIVADFIVEAAGAAGGGSVSHPSAIVNVIASVVFDLCFVGTALWAARARAPLDPEDFGYRHVGLRRAVPALLLAAAVYFLGSDLYAGLVHLHGEKLPKELGFGGGTGALVAAGVFVCVLAPILEEFFFRGFLFGALRQLPLRLGATDMGPPVAAVLVGILFGLAHAGSAALQYLPPLAFFGVILCLLRWRTGSLYPGMALHSINNSLALAVNQLNWGAGRVVGLTVAALLAIAALTLPLSRPQWFTHQR
jgi:membrane protease YdiL (CAAX protease family)